MNIKILKEGDRYHVYIGDKDLWLSRMELVELRHSINSIPL
jgi:hypothetical protein|nr:MAG TPA: SHIGA-LIKE TOXIN I SUBUNIT B, RECEPTOR BINDING, PROTEIN-CARBOHYDRATE RECOGNITION [Caudoviricetes sp.]DAY98241.1 MAG TPA: SHIGA-LIKE TOXIN I SUBUNIT B, RECEPTOR BINDING, PROTEIN-CARBOHYDRATE RECOGNITION [Caudoviricetes sp.]